MTGTIISIIFVIVQLVPRLTAMEAMGSEAFLLLSFWCLIGFIFYWRTITRSTLVEYSSIATSGVALFALLIYSAFLWLAKHIDSKVNINQVHLSIVSGGIVLMVIIFMGLIIMIYIQNLVRKKHEAAELASIRAMERNYAKSRFLFNMSHDIRTPMNERLVNDMDNALAEKQFRVFYQPKYSIKGSTPVLTSVEALVRWFHPEYGVIPPDEFITLFEENGLIRKLDKYVWNEAADQIKRWKDEGLNIPVSVNVSRVDAFNPLLVEILSDITSSGISVSPISPVAM